MQTKATRVVLCAATWLWGCGGSGAEPARAPRGTGTGNGTAGSLQDPVLTCGPEDSHDYVASRFRCPDGKNPFGGDSRAAAESRRGSSRAESTGHFIDLYEVPCSSGVVRVHVDMYGCAEYAQKLEAVERGSPETDQLLAAFRGGEFERVLARCQSLPTDVASDERAWCSALEPASLHALGRRQEAMDYTQRTCAALPAASTMSDARASHIALVMIALSQLAGDGRLSLSESEKVSLFERWLAVCQVPKAQMDEVFERAKSGQ